MNTQKQIKALKQQIDLVELIGRYTTLRRSGRAFMGRCPFHADSSPSFYVDPVKRTYHCFGCGKSGDAITFIQDVEQIPFTEAVKRLGGPDMPAPKRVIDTPEPPALLPQAAHVDMATIEAAAANVDQTSLHRFLCSIFTNEAASCVCALYKVGAARYVNHQGGRAAALPYINAAGEAVDVKIMHFHPRTGSRKDAPPLFRWADGEISQTWYMAECKKSNQRDAWCCFGEHLLAANPHQPVAVVESEKSALMAAIVYPQYCWLAVGGKNNLSRIPWQKIGRRQVILFPDNDAHDQWQQEALLLRTKRHRVKVDSTVNQLLTGEHDDLADLLLHSLR